MTTVAYCCAQTNNLTNIWLLHYIDSKEMLFFLWITSYVYNFKFVIIFLLFEKILMPEVCDESSKELFPKQLGCYGLLLWWHYHMTLGCAVLVQGDSLPCLWNQNMTVLRLFWLHYRIYYTSVVFWIPRLCFLCGQFWLGFL